MAHDPNMRPHRLQPLHALFLGMHRSARVRDGPASRTRVRLVVGEATLARETIDWGGRAVERGGEHHESKFDKVQTM